jgi:hypothetical protein
MGAVPTPPVAFGSSASGVASLAVNSTSHPSTRASSSGSARILTDVLLTRAVRFGRLAFLVPFCDLLDLFGMGPLLHTSSIRMYTDLIGRKRRYYGGCRDYSPATSATTLLPGQDKPAPSVPTSEASSFVVSCGLRLSEVGLAEFRKPQVISGHLHRSAILKVFGVK